MRRAWSRVSWSTARTQPETYDTGSLSGQVCVSIRPDTTSQARSWGYSTLDLPVRPRSSVVLRQVEQLLAHGVHDGLHAGVELELLQDVADVVLHGVLGDEELLGHLAVVEALGHQPQHLELALGEAEGRALLTLGLRHLLELVDQLDRHRRADQRLALVDHADRLGDLL